MVNGYVYFFISYPLMFLINIEVFAWILFLCTPFQESVSLCSYVVTILWLILNYDMVFVN